MKQLNLIELPREVDVILKRATLLDGGPAYSDLVAELIQIGFEQYELCVAQHIDYIVDEHSRLIRPYTSMDRLLEEFPIVVQTNLSREELMDSIGPHMDHSRNDWNYMGVSFIVPLGMSEQVRVQFRLDDAEVASYFKLRFSKL